MNYTADELDVFMIELQSEERGIREDRGKRYGSPEDVLSNVAEFGADGAIVSFWECARRIRNMYGKEKDLKDLANAVQDGRNYLAYILCLETRELGQGEYNIPPEVTPEVSIPTGNDFYKPVEGKGL